MLAESEHSTRRSYWLWGVYLLLWSAAAAAVVAWSAADAVSEAEREFAAQMDGLVAEFDDQLDRQRLALESLALLVAAAGVDGAAQGVRHLFLRLPAVVGVEIRAAESRRGYLAGAAAGDPGAVRDAGRTRGYLLRQALPRGVIEMAVDVERLALAPPAGASLTVTAARRTWQLASAAAVSSAFLNFQGSRPLHRSLPGLTVELRRSLGWELLAGRRFLGVGAFLALSLPAVLLLARSHDRRERGRREAEQRLYRLANFDSLTGLPNRNLFRDRLNHALLRAQRRRASVALLFLDLDGFKAVNDSAGHEAGDRLLVMVAERLGRVVRAQDTVARLSGDEFVLILEDVRDRRDAERVVEDLRAAFDAPFVVDAFDFLVTASIGVALYPEDGRTAPELLRCADQKMYANKYPEWAPPAEVGEPIRLVRRDAGGQEAS